LRSWTFGVMTPSSSAPDVRCASGRRKADDDQTRPTGWDEFPFLGTPDNPEFMLYRVVPSRVRFMRESALDYHEVSIAPS
jgi:hypothetical protein